MHVHMTEVIPGKIVSYCRTIPMHSIKPQKRNSYINFILNVASFLLQNGTTLQIPNDNKWKLSVRASGGTSH